MKKAFSILVVLIIAVSAFGNGVSLNSPGTRAIAMGGAMIAHSSDYSTPYWNPAGLMNTEGMQASFFLTDLVPMASYKFDTYGIDAEAVTNHNFVPNFSFLWTCMVNENMRMGFSMIVPAGLGVEWEGDDLLAFGGPSHLDPGGLLANPFYGQSYDWMSHIGVLDFALSAAMKFGDKLNAGASLRMGYGMMEMQRGVDMVDITPLAVGSNPVPGEDGMVDTQYKEESSGMGFGLGLGVQYALNEKTNLGLSIRTPMNIKFEGDATFGTTESAFEREISWPMWVGGGVSYQVNDDLLVGLDVQWSQWSETQDVLTAEYTDINQEDDLTLLWEDAIQIRVGAEYMLNEQLALRAGFYTDPAPGVEETQQILIPQADYVVVAGGCGYKVNDKISIDAALEYLIGSDVEVDPLTYMSGVGMPGTHGINIFVWSLGATYTFK